jgi:hypothetical protein
LRSGCGTQKAARGRADGAASERRTGGATGHAADNRARSAADDSSRQGAVLLNRLTPGERECRGNDNKHLMHLFLQSGACHEKMTAQRAQGPVFEPFDNGDCKSLFPRKPRDSSRKRVAVNELPAAD